MTDLMFRSDALLEQLTSKQIEVLDHLILHKSNKEIAQELGIAPVTVQQRLDAVRDKWGTENRNATARVYGELIGIYDGSIYDTARVDAERRDQEWLKPNLNRSGVFQLHDVLASQDIEGWTSDRHGSEALDTRFGKVWRILAIPALAALLGTLAVAALTMADQLSARF